MNNNYRRSPPMKHRKSDGEQLAPTNSELILTGPRLNEKEICIHSPAA